MRSFGAIRTNLHHPATDSSGADQLRGRVLRHAGAPGCLCRCSGAACHFRPPSVGPIASSARSSLAVKADWSVATRSYPAFAVSQSDISGKTEAYEIFRHPGGGRKDIFRWAEQDGKPVVELEIYRPGSELGASTPPSSNSPPGWNLARVNWRQQELVDSKFGTVTLLRAAGAPNDARSCPVSSNASISPACEFPAGPASQARCRPGALPLAAC